MARLRLLHYLASMNDSDSNTGDPSPRLPNQMVVGILPDADALVSAVHALIGSGFDHQDISVLARQEVLRQHFGDVIPQVELLAGDADVPRQPVRAGDSVVRWLAHLVAEGVAAIGLIGATGLAYAVGGPVGVAAVAGDTAESSLEAVLSSGIDDAEAAHYRTGLADGAVVCWAGCRDADAIATATRLLTEHGATGVHMVAQA